MLTQALAVVEAVRGLDPRPVAAVPGMWRLQVEARHMPLRLRELGEALEHFDSEAGNKHSPETMVLRAVMSAAKRGVKLDEMIGAIDSLGADDELREASSLAELKPQPGELGAPDRVSDSSPVPAPAPRPDSPASEGRPADKYLAPTPGKPTQSLRPATPIFSQGNAPVITGQTAVGTSLQRYVDELGLDADMALADAGDYAADADMEMDAIGDRLAMVLGKYGMTPKLRILLAAYVNARNQASVDVNRPGGGRMGAAEAGVLARVAADIEMINANPSLAYKDDPESQLGAEFTPPTPALRPKQW